MKRKSILLSLAFAAAFSSVASAQRVDITSNPPGATVYVDDPNGTPIGTTPLSRVRLRRGSYTLHFRLANHADAQLPVTVQRWRESFSVNLQAQSVIVLNAANEGAQGAQVRIDGEPVGALPVRQTVEPGRHLVQVGREGYNTLSQWVEVEGAQVATLPVMLERAAPETGSILVAGDTTGAAIFVDGDPRGTAPTVLDNIPAGQHSVEIRPPTGQELQPVQQTVLVIAGERAVVNFTLQPTAPAGGTLRVLANVPAAVISIDGEAAGNSPAVREGLAPGDHIVEARADGYQPITRPVTIEAGREQVVSLELQEVQRAAGRIVINSDVDGATVTVDGEARGTPPVVIEDAPAGTHAIVVSAPGRRDFRQTCTTGPGVDCELTIDMDAAPAPIRVVEANNVSGAQLYVDGELVGPVPFEGTVPSGNHQVEVRAPGYESFTAQMNFEASAEPRVVDVALRQEGALSDDELEMQEAEILFRHQQTVARSGVPLPQDLAVLDFSVGWPYLFEARLGIGIMDWLDAGIALRTFFRLTEFEARVKAGFRPVEQFSIGGQFRIGGGLGGSADLVDNVDVTRDDMGQITGRPTWGTGENETSLAEDIAGHPTNNFFFSLEALFSLHFASAGNFTLWTGFDFYSDRWDWHESHRDCRFAGGCNDDMNGSPVAADPSLGILAPNGERQNLARFRIGGSLEIIFSRRWNGWVSFEGAFGPDRRIVGDILGFNNSDIQMYTRLGLTYKFDYGH